MYPNDDPFQEKSFSDSKCNHYTNTTQINTKINKREKSKIYIKKQAFLPCVASNFT